MPKYDSLLAKASQFEKTAQAQMPAAPEDVENAFKRAGVWDLSNQIAPLLGRLQIGDATSVNLGMNVIPTKDVQVVATLNPPDPAKAKALAGTLQKMYGGKMSAALQASKLNIIDPIAIKWITF